VLLSSWSPAPRCSSNGGRRLFSLLAVTGIVGLLLALLIELGQSCVPELLRSEPNYYQEHCFRSGFTAF
jgi:hypothetical protein